MSDNKEQNNNPLTEEMDELARIFQEELQKAVKESEAAAEVDATTLEVEGYNPRAVSKSESKSKKAEVKLCEICSEKKCGTAKNPNSPYCKECEELLEKYPYDRWGVLAFVVTICITIAAVFFFATETPVFSAMQQGDKAIRNNQLYSARAEYDKALSYIEAEDLGENLNFHKKDIMLSYELLDRETALTALDSYYTEGLLKTPMYKSLAELRESIGALQATATAIQGYLYEYNAITDNNYQEIIDTLSSLSGKKIYVVNGNCYDENSDYEPDGSETVYTYDEGWIYIYKYSVAYECGKDKSVIIEFLEKSREYNSLKALIDPLLATTYVGAGEYEKAEKLAKEINDYNEECIDYHLVMSMLARYDEQNYDKAISKCNEGLNILKGLDNAETMLPSYGYILEMQKCINYILLEDYERAYEAITSCYNYQLESGSMTLQVRDMYAMLALENGDNDVFTALEEEIEEYTYSSIAFTADVTNYREGKVTLQEIVMDGGYDLL